MCEIIITQDITFRRFGFNRSTDPYPSEIGFTKYEVKKKVEIKSNFDSSV